jgi:hypothetical protein
LVKVAQPPAAGGICASLIQVIAKEFNVPVEASLDLIAAKSRTPVLPLEHYDWDVEITRRFPAALCRRWCVVPFDQMSEATLIATANPFNRQAEDELLKAGARSVLWYLSPPRQLVQALRRAFA